MIFIIGLHRSGTSLLHEILTSHPEITGLKKEGQFLQSVLPTGQTFGGPGKFCFNKNSYMDESHILATEENAKKIYRQWFGDINSEFAIEKSPPSIVRTRFFQKLFPESKFIAILRDPLVVSMATKKWTDSNLSLLLTHTHLAYDIFNKDKKFLKNVKVIHYEELVKEPQKVIDGIFCFLGLKTIEVTHRIDKNINEKYYQQYKNLSSHPIL